MEPSRLIANVRPFIALFERTYADNRLVSPGKCVLR